MMEQACFFVAKFSAEEAWMQRISVYPGNIGNHILFIMRRVILKVELDQNITCPNDNNNKNLSWGILQACLLSCQVTHVSQGAKADNYEKFYCRIMRFHELVLRALKPGDFS